MNKKILIAGASGQLAKAFIKKFTELNISFYAPTEQEFDITDKIKIENIFSQYNPNIVINCAAYNNVEAAQQDNTKAFLINRDSVINLGEACLKYRA
ncbi:MAG: sugar nucleotide-binding protein, partial [Elusimicrobia bacterium]|nr:sugar nucleotide-binding protein [Elusimicrobiota bacterium]